MAAFPADAQLQEWALKALGRLLRLQAAVHRAAAAGVDRLCVAAAGAHKGVQVAGAACVALGLAFVSPAAAQRAAAVGAVAAVLSALAAFRHDRNVPCFAFGALHNLVTSKPEPPGLAGEPARTARSCPPTLSDPDPDF